MSERITKHSADVRHVELRRGAYRDSVRLMQISRTVAATPGVSSALVAMATELNLDLLTGMGFTAPPEATANDMVVAVHADDDSTAATALANLESQLADRPAASTGFGTPPRPRTVAAGLRRLDGALALISTPGRYAFCDAMDALDAGTSVMLFSDNVPVAEELRLKEIAADRGLLVLGPDCGTAVIGGVGLGFANVVRPGPVGLVAASGTGAQQLMCLLDAAGVGISHCLGVGGRDLSTEVAGRSTLAALDALDADPATELIVVVSKPPADEVSARIREHAGKLATPVVFALLGAGKPDLTAATAEALRQLGEAVPEPWPRWLPETAATPRAGSLRGLFSGGTLCDEAMVIASEQLGRVESNIPLRPDWRLPDDLAATGHAMIDFGDDALTQGRPHPMIDGTLRLERLAREVTDADGAVVLLDVVLGHAAHPDPAADLAPAVTSAVDAGTAVVVSLTGSADDPQDRDRQAGVLRDAGAAVFASNAEAARYAVSLVEGGTSR